MSDEQQEPTPAELRMLAAQTEALEQRIAEIQDRLRASEETRDTAFRLADAAENMRRGRDALELTVADLARIRTRRDPRLCGVPWGVCPEHGNTLRGSGGRAWCTDPGCTRSWGYDKLGTTCGEPVTHTITDAAGTSFPACRGHAMDAEQRLEGGTVVELPSATA
ncbi:hypothetical protein XF35_39545 [Streptomyces platensis subsp. clarensis]|uniref:Uncharacterized protein n=1 Tax=Streptomyces showdoensis TaxID=68268 RepID=A0A2P2GKV6_STREW|nr:hypothetical protein [Streptomyces showdoensis]KKZ72137.1 hypothetical protein VO63_20410 [Streptomyces showdoensis]MCW7991146.1 hypothetical protein [Streptomyces platensis subsp. clarensis]